MSKCKGCGTVLQNSDSEKLGYVIDIASNLCMRCFKIKNYNDYKLVTQDNKEFIEILKNINKTNDLVILVVDIFTPGDLPLFHKYLDNDILLVLTKRDLISKSVSDSKILNYFKFKCIDKILVSAYKNYNFDDLFSLIKKYKKSNNVYVVGYTNAGKSSLINKLIYNYTSKNSEITTSSLPSTTISSIKINLNDLTLIDTPGLINKGSIINYLDPNMIKKITPKTTIKPITYQIKSEQTFTIENFFQLLTNNANLTFYLSNQLQLKRQYKNIINIEGKYYKFKIKKDQDLVIEGLGFIKCSKDCEIDIICIKGVRVYLRNSLI